MMQMANFSKMPLYLQGKMDVLENDLFKYLTGESKKKFRRLEGCGIKSMCRIFKTEMFIYQSKVNLDEKILFGSIPHLADPEIRKMLVKGMFWNKNSTFHSGP